MGRLLHRTPWALAGLALSMLLSSLGTSIANVALPSLAEALGATFQDVAWVVLAYLLAITSSIVSVGRLGDRVGRRRLLQAGILVFTSASILAGLAPTLGVLLVARAVQGLGAAVMMALTIAFVSDIVPGDRTGSAMGLLGTTSALGTALGPSLGGALIAWFGWPAIFFINVPIGIVALVLVHRHVPADRPTTRVEFDHLGTLVLASTLAAYSLALTLGRGEIGRRDLALLGVAAIGVGVFLLVERRSAAPLIRLSMFRDRALSAGLFASLLVSTVVMATLVVGPFYLARALRLETGVIGIVMSVGPIVAALTGVPAGHLVDRFGTRRVTLVGLVGMAVGCLLLSVTPLAFAIPGYVVPIVIITANYAMFQAANNTAVMRDVGPDQRGVVSGTLNLSRNLGLITGASVMGFVFALGSGTSDITTAPPEAVATGMQLTFAVAGALIMLSLAAVAGARALTAGMLALILFPGVAAAQQPTKSEAPALVLRSDDGANSLRVIGLLQPQLARDGFFVNRARMGLLGSAFDGDLQSMLVVEFAGETPKLLFAHVDYALVPSWLIIRVGQFKRPFSRPFVVFASQLSMIDRPLTVGPGVFGDNADVGVMLHDGIDGRFEYAVGVFNGTGPGLRPDHVHPLVAMRIAYNSGGLRPYTESDLEGGPLRVGVAAAGIIDFDADADQQSFASGLVDVLIKARGVSLASAVYLGSRQHGPRLADQRIEGFGHYTQLGYVIADRVEPVLRYSFLQTHGGRDELHDAAGGFNLFFRGHAFKWQNFASVRFQPGDGHSTPDVLVQSQLSLSF